MINKRNILAAATLICLAFTPANASNLVQMDITKTSDNAVDVTFYTTGASGNAMVTRKSNNKYVVLMPEVSGKPASAPDLSSVKDIITGVDVKNVDDGMSGYTKITFITTRPLNIKTHVKKSTPMTQEEKEAKALIAQVKTHPKQTVAPQAPKKETPKTIVNVSAAAEKVQNIVKKAEPKKAEPKKEIVPPVNQTVQKPAQNTAQPAAQSPAPQSSAEKIAQKPVQENVSNKLDIKEIEKIEKISQPQNQPSKNKFGWAIILLPVLGLYLFAKMIRNSIQKSNVLKASFAENLAEKPHVQENYDDIINDTELNWQERYQKFVKESKGEVKNRKYNFIKTEEPLNEIDKKRLELESTLEKTPEIYKSHKIDIAEEPVEKVQSEDDVISKEIGEIKLKAFAKPASLLTSNRHRAKKYQPDYKPAKEGKFVKLQQNPINSSTRSFKDANLKVGDLIKTGSQYLENNADTVNIDKEQDYIMSSVEEYFALLDKEQIRKTSIPADDLSSRVAASLAQIKPSMNMKKPAAKASNPIKRNNDNYLNGLVVKSGYNIDENRGFYLVSLDGVTALVGRVKDEILVIKKFDENVDNLQVRLDSENVYMVKAGGFKSLVDVDENKMGVLIEL